MAQAEEQAEERAKPADAPQQLMFGQAGYTVLDGRALFVFKPAEGASYTVAIRPSPDDIRVGGKKAKEDSNTGGVIVEGKDEPVLIRAAWENPGIGTVAVTMTRL